MHRLQQKETQESATVFPGEGTGLLLVGEEGDFIVYVCCTFHYISGLPL